jgi:hypothetical protein
MGLLRGAGYLLLSGTLASAANAQNVPANILPDIGQAYLCEANLKWPGEDREVPAIVEVARIGDNYMRITAGKKHAYQFATVTEARKYISDEIIMSVIGSVYGDDPADTFMTNGVPIGWDIEKKRSDIGPREINFFDDVANHMVGCKRTPVTVQ